MFRRFVYIIIFGLSCNLALANENEVRWQGEGELGLAITTGNSETETLNARVRLTKDGEFWRHELGLTALNVANEQNTTAERYTFNHKTDYKIDNNEYLFGAFRYDSDRFSGFDYQSTLTFGYGRRVLDNARNRLDVETGLGYRLAETAQGESENEPIGRLYGDYSYKVSDNAVFSQTLLVETGPDNTFSESISALRVRFLEKLALRVSYTARNNSSTPAGRQATDTITSAAIVYSF